MKTFNDVKEILIAGGGMMGKNIAYVMTKNPNLHVTVYDLFPTDVEAGIRTNTKQLVDRGHVTEEELAEQLSRIYFTTDIDDPAIAKADLVIEAVFEDMKIKRETFAKLEARCAEDCIFCTNSSVMSPSEISAELKHRERFVGTHFWNPGHLIPLVEVVKTDATGDGVAETVMEVLASAGNADAETVDIAIKNSFGLRLPQLSALENSDMVGTQLTWNIHSYVLKDLEDSHEPSPLLKQMLDEGKLGFKSGEGFMKWTQEEIDKCNADLNSYLIHMLYER